MQVLENPIEEFIKKVVQSEMKTVFSDYDLEVRGDLKTLMHMAKMGENSCRNLLTAFRPEMDDDLDGGFVTYDTHKYTFDKQRMKEWLLNNQWIYKDQSWKPGRK